MRRRLRGAFIACSVYSVRRWLRWLRHDTGEADTPEALIVQCPEGLGVPMLLTVLRLLKTLSVGLREIHAKYLFKLAILLNRKNDFCWLAGFICHIFFG